MVSMSCEEFEDSLRQFLRREPFQPFMVELLDGSLITVEHSGVALGGGSALYCTPAYEFVEFACENVRTIRQATHQAAS